MDEIVVNEKVSLVNVATLSSKNAKKVDRGKATRQIVAALFANIGTINTGMIFGYSAMAIPQLLEPDAKVHVNENQASWIAAISSTTTPFGCILGGILMDRIGRKRTLLITELPLIVGWLIVAFATNMEMICAGRLLLGLGSGMVGAPARVYTSEVTQPHLRGMLTALASIGISVGVLLQYIFGSFLAWNVLAGVSTTIGISAFISMVFLPETPNYMITKSKKDKAVKYMGRLRGSTYNVQREVNVLEDFAVKNQIQKASTKEILEALTSAATVKPFLILITYFFIFQFSGINTLTFYTVEIVHDTGTKWDKFSCTVSIGIVRLLFTILSAIALRKVGRRPLTFLSSIGCALTMLGLGGYLYYKHTVDTAGMGGELQYTWFPIACLFVYFIVCPLGYLVVPWVMIGELYPQKVRGIVGGMTSCAAHISIFAVVKTYPVLCELLGKHGVFTFYGLVSLFGTIFLYIFLPETKGKSLLEIEDFFSGRTKSLTATRKTDLKI